MSAEFELDPRLAADTAEIGRTSLSLVLLMNDARFPWIMLVPMRPAIRELYELSTADAHRLLDESLLLGRLMGAQDPTAKLNVANLGNIVAQLHLHHVLRTPADAAWPGPVWGFGTRTGRSDAERTATLEFWRQQLAPLLDR
ncbi:MAG TPA: HIT family protein [Pseudomonadales bacterium]|nr:HIT family protein [Pseudomonadales bacterium]